MVHRRGFLLAALAASSLRAQDDAAALVNRLGGELERNAAGQIVRVDLSGTWAHDADMRWLAQVPTLEEINLGRTRITGKGLAWLTELEHVTDLNLRFAEFITATDIGRLAPWKNLRALDLRGARVDSGVFERLAAHNQLESLDISSTEVGDEGFEELTALARLSELRCGANRLNGSALTVLKTAPALRSLDVGGYQRVESGLWGLALSEQNLIRLGELAQLESLTLRGAKLADQDAGPTGENLALQQQIVGLQNLAPLAELRSLDLGDLPIESAELSWLPALSKLTELDIDGSFQIDDAIVGVLRKLPSLQRLNLAATLLTDAGLHELAGITSLQRLVIGGTQVTAAAVAAFTRQRPDCKVISWNAA